MGAKGTHFRVGNGDMLHLDLESGRCILVDINIRQAAADENDDTPNVIEQLRSRLKRDAQGRLYIDAFLLTHPDQDHCRGLEEYFHLGPLSEWDADEDKIVILEMWSSPIVFRRASKSHCLCSDAEAWRQEARRRVARYRESYGFVADGERIKILGEDIDGKTNGLEPILVKVDETFATICGAWDDSFEARLVAPLPPTDDDEEEVLSKNNSSVILRLDLTGDGKAGACRYLIGGDAEVAIWERIWEKYKDHSDLLTYDILVAPHHCSWHSLSNDRWSEMGDDAEVSEAARNALEQAGYGAVIVSSSCPIADDDDDPPCIRAKREYEDILKPQSGEFRCLGDGDDPEPVVFEVSWAGPKLKRASIAASVTLGTGLGTQPLQHG